MKSQSQAFKGITFLHHGHNSLEKELMNPTTQW